MSADRPRVAGQRAAAAGPRVRERTVPAWFPRAVLVLCVLGALVAAYLTLESLTGGATLACPETDTVNCAKVTDSQWSKILGVPVAPLGIVFFAVLLWLSRPALLRRETGHGDRLRLAWVSIGLAMVLYLVWAELFQIGAICLWCTVVHVLTFALFVVVLFGQILIQPPPPRVRYKDRPR